jgi:hypothetical protein
MQNFKSFKDFQEYIAKRFTHVSQETFGWLAIIVLHTSTLPSLLALMSGLTDRVPPVDMVILVWTALTLLFIRSAIQKDMLNLVTNGLGFIFQAALLALVFLK